MTQSASAGSPGASVGAGAGAPAGAGSAVHAPQAPGGLGVAAEPRALLTYLTDLEAWLDARRAELDRLDAAARRSADPSAFTADVVLALTLWQAVRTRTDELVRVWDSGRASIVERERISQLVWGRLGGDPATSLLSLVEAARLCDALAGQLATRLSYDPHAADLATRLRTVAAGIARAEDAARGDDVARVARLRERLGKVRADASRGADVAGPLAELEAEIARTERDLIVAGARRRSLVRDRERAVALRETLAARAPVLAEVAERCRREIAAPPRLAVPDVNRLGEVPSDRDALATYVERLGAVERALDACEEAYTGPLRERAELRFRVKGLLTRAGRNGRAASATVVAGTAEARDALETTPCDLALARHFVDQLEVLVRDLPEGHR
ncbi:hypothetical protein [Antribacter gilvus]|uniref:hypothetical protein n=1 Tax=Antribacter gilvus TaxID=2304675 RepID=UPI001F0CA581|nr:hypothetical protein [Antribacter gilvus]